ncbi:glycosyltransferase family 39 protein, partial [Candidatus Roizmanbacteria bacterium]|nr:glycosyltransferase family 39 protein [Candidatus Roizmanbacteria bacterium]
MNKKWFLFIWLVFFLFLFFFNARLLQRGVANNDEGIYTTTFLLVSKGQLLYRQIFFSQPPDFFFSTYPGFILFGKTVFAARLTIFLWSLIGIIGIIWLAKEIGNIWVGLLGAYLLYAIPSYTNQIVTLQSDALVVVFSTLSLASFWRYKNTANVFWFIVGSVFFLVSFWTKLDVSLILPLAFLFWNIKNKARLTFIFISVFFTVSAVFVLPFGLDAVWNSIIGLRNQAFSTHPFDPLALFNYLKNDVVLFLVIVVSIFLFWKSKNSSVLFFWAVSILFL